MSREQIIAELTGPGGAFEVRATRVNDVPMRVFRNAPPSMRAVFESTRAFADRDSSSMRTNAGRLRITTGA